MLWKCKIKMGSTKIDICSMHLDTMKLRVLVKSEMIMQLLIVLEDTGRVIHSSQ
jgi:hypothetical protein